MAYHARRLREGWAAVFAHALLRSWEIYAAFLILILVLVMVAQGSRSAELADEANVKVLLQAPGVPLTRAAILQYRPVNTDALPTFVLFRLSFAPVLWGILKFPGVSLLISTWIRNGSCIFWLPPSSWRDSFRRRGRVAFFSISGSEFVEMFVGVVAARVRDLFEQARKAAPCIIFIDELDALGRNRTPGAFGGYDEKEQTLKQLLAELDGFDPRVGVILLAATNRPESLDPVLLRAGRFDRQVLVDRPDTNGRAAILKVHISKIRVSRGVDLDRIASLTAGFTGADIAQSDQ
ncbi:hypothetical protein ACVWW1_003401 [Bradyrhizobium sp. JR3.5]